MENVKSESKMKIYFKDLLFSLFKTKKLFKFAFYKWITPIVIFILVSTIIVLPSIISYNKLTITSINSNILYIDEVMAHVLDSDIKCSINEKGLTCEEGYTFDEEYHFYNDNNDEIIYRIIINKDITDIDFKTGAFGEHFKTDNYLIFFPTTFSYRYTYHNPKTKTVEVSSGYGLYDELNGFDFAKVYQESLAKEDSQAYLLNEGADFILKGYKAFAHETAFMGAVINIGLYLVFCLVIALLIKGNYLIRKGKGFKYRQALKIAIVASLQSALLALIVSLLGFSFMNMFGLLLVIRVLYIYFKYTGRNKTEWLQEIYKETGDERFNV